MNPISSTDVKNPTAVNNDAPVTANALAGNARPQAGVGDDLSTMFTQEVASNSKLLSERTFGVRVPPAEQMAQLYDRLGHPAQAALATVARNLRIQLMLDPRVDKLLALTEKDPCKLSVALQYLVAQAKTEGRSSEANSALSVLVDLERDYQPQIQAGLNTALALQAGSDDPHLRQAVRNVYYTSVVARQSLATIMQSLLGLFGADEFAAGLNLIRRALADDMAAANPSRDRGKLRTLMLGLNDCRRLGGVLSSCKALIEKLRVTYPEVGQDAVALLQRLLGYAAMGLDANEAVQLGMDYGGPNKSNQLLALQQMFRQLKELPVSWWGDTKGRDDALALYRVVLVEFARVLEQGRVPFRAWEGLEA